MTAAIGSYEEYSLDYQRQIIVIHQADPELLRPARTYLAAA
jgi:hypothetical protein